MTQEEYLELAKDTRKPLTLADLGDRDGVGLGWKIGAPRKDTENGGMYRVLKDSKGGWIGDLRENCKADEENLRLIMAAGKLLKALQATLAAWRVECAQGDGVHEDHLLTMAYADSAINDVLSQP